MKKDCCHTSSSAPPFNFDLRSTAKGFERSIVNHLRFTFARDVSAARMSDWWGATCMAVRDRMLERFMQTFSAHYEARCRRLYYFSLEYMMGRLLLNNLINIGLFHPAKLALENLGVNPQLLFEEEPDMGLGNGGLGRLAACFLDSLATLDYPAIGYGIYYEYGLFSQEFVNGRQIEHPDNWLKFGNPWPFIRREESVQVQVYGRVEDRYNAAGEWCPAWVDTKDFIGVPQDIPIVGFGGGTVNFLRLWESRASTEFDFNVFNEGGYVEAVHEKAIGETFSKVLYPNDRTENGKELRLVQQYFFVACSLRDIIRRHQNTGATWDSFPDKVAIQLNDTHPTIAIAELMRLLLDEYGFSWDRAWSICRQIFGYTNHTLLPEALECWSVPLFRRVLPRHLQIIKEINQRFLDNEVEVKWPGNDDKKRALSLIEEGNVQRVRMAHLAIIGSHRVNGVAALHTQLLRQKLFTDFDQLYPDKFINVTNGITPRRWLRVCNPRLAALLDETLGHGWISDLALLRQLENYAEDTEFQRAFRQVKQRNKEDFAQVIEQECGIAVDPAAIFDVQIKRFHEYKRQHLNLLHILTLYHRLLDDPDLDIHPRVFIFGGKAAPGYDMAKAIIHAINRVANVINHDKRIKGKLKVVFLPNYSVTLAEQIIPASDVSEQISTAGKEASGTGNMKLALNGAITIGTLDGANIEIHEEVGEENIFIFGLTADEVESLCKSGYNPHDYYNSITILRDILDWLASDFFAPGEPGVIAPVRWGLLDGGDPFFVLADYAAYCRVQGQVDQAYRQPKRWTKMAICNTARLGKFSADRAVREYAEKIWDLQPITVDAEPTLVYSG